jgi:hypothetical protein
VGSLTPPTVDVNRMCDKLLLVREETIRKQAQRLIARKGLRGAAEAIGVRFDALARFVAGAKSHKGTLLQIEAGLRR